MWVCLTNRNYSWIEPSGQRPNIFHSTCLLYKWLILKYIGIYFCPRDKYFDMQIPKKNFKMKGCTNKKILWKLSYHNMHWIQVSCVKINLTYVVFTLYLFKISLYCFLFHFFFFPSSNCHLHVSLGLKIPVLSL